MENLVRNISTGLVGNSINDKTAFINNLFPNIALANNEEEVMKYEKQLEEDTEQKKQNHFEKCGVGSKYLNKTIDDFVTDTEERKKNLELVKKFIEDVNGGKCRTLWLCGNNGNGKTLLASIICRECWGTFRSVYEIEDDLKLADSFKAQENRKEVFERYKDYKLLAIDEVGRFPSDTELKFLFHILNDRYENEKSTVLITNLGQKDLKEYLGKALVDRFVENCTSVYFSGESYRKVERGNTMK